MDKESVGQRIVVVGTTGSGKTTLAQQLGEKLTLPHTSLDALNWGPKWTPVPVETFRERTAQLVAAHCWIVDGNYTAVRDIVWGQADTLIWLDYSLPLIFWRLTKRSLHRILSQEELWGGNRESFRAQFLSRDSLYLWALKGHSRRRREYPELFAQPAYAHLSRFTFRSPSATQQWLDELGVGG